MKKNWKQYRLDEICIIIAGQSPGSYTYNTSKIGLPFYQGKADFGQISPSPTVWCNEPIKIAEKGDILLSVRAPVGLTNMANEKCCIGRGLCAIRTDENIDRQYLFVYLRSIENELLKMGSGTTFQSITIEDVRKIIISLPSLDEQKNIVQIIETKLNAVEKAKKAAVEQLESINALPSSILYQAFKE